MAKLAIGAGHYEKAGEAVPNYMGVGKISEWSLNNRVVNYTLMELDSYDGLEILRTDDKTGKKNVSLPTRAKKANDWKADLYISVHHDAGIGGKRLDKNGNKTGGITVFRYPSSTKFTKSMQKSLYDLLIKYTGLKGNRAQPMREANFAILRLTNMPAVLIENGYMDSPNDLPIIMSETHAQKTAKAIAEFVVKELKLKRKQHTTTLPKNVYIVKKGDTLSAIARKYGTTWQTLKALNKIQNVNLIRPGQRIKLPDNKVPAVKEQTKAQAKKFRVGEKVRLQSGAKKYATGQNIPVWVKLRSHTIQQMKTDRALLKEIMSWVYLKDLK